MRCCVEPFAALIKGEADDGGQGSRAIMKFSGNLAWQEGLAAISANRTVLLPVAGVFFLLPSIASVWFMSDVQRSLMDNFGNQAAMEKALEAMGPGMIAGGLLAGLFQMAGFMALLSLFTDRNRPTVGEAILSGLRCLPSLIGAIILFFLGLSIALAVLITLVAAVGAAVPALGVVLGLLAFALFAYIPVKLSLTMPVIVIDNVLNPIAALVHSWRLTRGNSLLIFGFYLLLFIGYMVLTMALFAVVGVFIGMSRLAVGAAPPGSIALIAMGLISGMIGAVVNLLFSGILAAIHRQLSGPSSEAISETFR